MKRFSFIAFFFWGLSNLFAAPGRLDPSFTPTPPPNGKVHALYLHPDGGIIIGGEFTEPRAYLAKYNANGILDASFSPTLDGPVYALEIISSFDLILIGGSFENLNAIPSKSFGGIKLDGTLHPNSQYIYDSGFDGPVYAIELQSTNSIAGLLVGGEFSFFQGRSSNNLAGFGTTSFSRAITFQTDYRLNGKVNTISRTSGSMGRYVGGTFTIAGTSSVQNCALITGTSAGNPNFKVQDEVFAIQPYSRNPAGPLQVKSLARIFHE